MSGIPHKNKDAARGVFVDTSCITPLPSSQLINEYGVKHDPHCLDNLIRNQYNNPEYWHKFTVCNESYSYSQYPKNFILKVICDFVYPCELLPVYVSQKAANTYFLARNCLEAILKLCKAGLNVPNPNRPESPFKVVIIKDVLTLQHIPNVNVQPNLLEVLKKRHSNGVLDLSKFHEDKDLKEFFLLSQPKLLLYVLSLIPEVVKSKVYTTAVSKIAMIILSNNDIKHLPNLDSLTVRTFAALDLSHNKIQNIEDLVPLKDFPDLMDINLDGNPLCCRFDSGITYFLYVKSICRKLVTLDKRRILKDGFYKKEKTFLCDTKGFNFANQFLEQYFIYYDEANRPNIGSFYDENAMFSLSYRDKPSHFWLNVENRVASEYRIRSRNFMDPCFNQSAPDAYPLVLGKDQVLQQLRSLPATQHHPYTFNIDLVTYSKTQAVIHVTGKFKSLTLSFGFSRTFVLSSQEGREWVITNDQLCATAPSTNQANLDRWPKQITPSLFPDPTFYLEHMDAVTSTFEAITGMAYEHSRKFLTKNNWNLELALKVFIDEHINDEIPDEAFNDESKYELLEDSDDDSVIITEDDILPRIDTLIVDEHKEFVQSFDSEALPSEAKQRRIRRAKQRINKYKAAKHQKRVLNQNVTEFFDETTQNILSPVDALIVDKHKEFVQSFDSGAKHNNTQTVIPSQPPNQLLIRGAEQSKKSFTSQYQQPVPNQNVTELSDEVKQHVLPPIKSLIGDKHKQFVQSFGRVKHNNTHAVIVSQPPNQLPNRGAEQNKEKATVVSSQYQQPVPNQNVTELSDEVTQNIPDPLSIPIATGPTTLISSSPSFQNLLTDSASQPEGSNVHFTNIFLDEEEELAKLVMLQPRPSDWSAELWGRLAALRPSGQALGNKSCSPRLTTHEGKRIRLSLSEQLFNPATIHAASSSYSQNSTNALQSSEVYSTSTKVIAPEKLSITKPPTRLPSTSSSQNFSSDRLLAVKRSQVYFPSPCPPKKPRDDKKLVKPMTLNTESSNWNVKVNLSEKVSIQRLSSSTQNSFTYPLPKNDNPEVGSTSPLPLKRLHEDENLSILPSSSISPTSLENPLPKLAEPEGLSPKTPLSLRHKISEEEEDELAKLVISSNWSPELRARLEALRPPHAKPEKRYRLRLKTQAGKSVRVNIFPSQKSSTILKADVPEVFFTSSLSPKKPQEDEKSVEQMILKTESSDCSVKDTLSEKVSILPLSLSTQNSSTYPIPKPDSPEVGSTPRRTQRITEEEEHELADLVMAQPKFLQWSPELRARLVALRPQRHSSMKRCRIRLTTRAGERVRFRLPDELYTPQSLSSLQNSSTGLVLKESEVNITSPHPLKKLHVDEKLSILPLSSFTPNSLESPLPKLDEPEGLSPKKPLEVEKLTEQMMLQPETADWNVKMNLDEKLSIINPSSFPPNCLENPLLKLAEPEGLAPKNPLEEEKLTEQMIPPSSFTQNSSTYPLPKPDNPEVGATPRRTQRITEDEEHELADLVMAQPKFSQWSPELRARLVALRPKRHSSMKRCRIRLTTRAGERVRFRLPNELYTPQSLSSLQNSSTDLVLKESEVNITSPHPLKKLHVDEKLSILPLSSFAPNSLESPLPKLDEPEGLSPKKPLEVEKLTEQIMLQPGSSHWNVKTNLHEKLSVLSPSSIPPNCLENPLLKLAEPEGLASKNPLEVEKLTEQMIPPSSFTQNSSTYPLPKPDNPEVGASSLRTQRITEDEEHELANLVMAQPNPSQWSPELRARLAALRPPDRVRRYRIRLTNRAGERVRVRLPNELYTPLSNPPQFLSSSQNSLTDLVLKKSEVNITSPHPLNKLHEDEKLSILPLPSFTPNSLESRLPKLDEPEGLSPKKPLQVEKLTEQMMLQPETSDWNDKMNVDEKLSIINPSSFPPICLENPLLKLAEPEGLAPKNPLEEEKLTEQMIPPSSFTQNSSTYPLPKPDNPEVGATPRRTQRITEDEEHELADLVMAQPKFSQWSPELRARLVALRPKRHSSMKRCRIRLTTRAGERVRFRLPNELYTPQSLSSLQNSSTDLVLKESEVNITSPHPLKKLHVDEKLSILPLSSFAPNSLESPLPKLDEPEGLSPKKPLEVEKLTEQIMLQPGSSHWNVKTNLHEKLSVLSPSSIPPNCLENPLLKLAEPEGLASKNPLEVEKLTEQMIPPSSFTQNSSTYPLPKPDNPEVGASSLRTQRITEDEEHELANLVMAQPNPSQWSPELRARLAALRPPDRVRRYRIRLTNRAGERVRVRLPNELYTPLSNPPQFLSSSQNSLTDLVLKKSEVNITSPHPLNKLHEDEKLSILPLPSFTPNSLESRLPKLDEPEGLSPKKPLQVEKLTEQMMLQPETSDWNDKMNVDEKLSIINPSSFPPICLENPLLKLAEPEGLAPKNPLGVEKLTEQMIPPSSFTQNSSTYPLPKPDNPEVGATARRTQRITEDEEHELADLVIAQPNPSQWSPELRARLAALRPPGRVRRYRIRLTNRAGERVRFRLPSALYTPLSNPPQFLSSSQNSSTDLVIKKSEVNITSPLPHKRLHEDEKLSICLSSFNPKSLENPLPKLAEPEGLSSKKQLDKEKLTEQIMLQPESSDWNVKMNLSEKVSIHPVPITKDSLQYPLPKLNESEVCLTALRHKISVEEEDELAKLVMAQPMSPELRAGLEALRPPHATSSVPPKKQQDEKLVEQNQMILKTESSD